MHRAPTLEEGKPLALEAKDKVTLGVANTCMSTLQEWCPGFPQNAHWEPGSWGPAQVKAQPARTPKVPVPVPSHATALPGPKAGGRARPWGSSTSLQGLLPPYPELPRAGTSLSSAGAGPLLTGLAQRPPL